MLEAVLINALAIWLAFFLVNHAELTARLRAAVMPVLPRWLATLVSCPLCASFWSLVAVSLFVGFTPMVLLVPQVVLFIDLAFLRLKPAAAAQPPILPTT